MVNSAPKAAVPLAVNLATALAGMVLVRVPAVNTVEAQVPASSVEAPVLEVAKALVEPKALDISVEAKPVASTLDRVQDRQEVLIHTTRLGAILTMKD